ncbi:hypothetical protein PPYR_07026 [Photinus pyralis]|uniref:Gamma-interferon-inducible lysosomal thiol reductase n=2 Tax=Photinus pyralis TaxID=7054 RepID=A0A5N4APB5_PHOPY|nr:hypothetical protein PPYR_07026 [Photinus pyralis]
MKVEVVRRMVKIILIAFFTLLNGHSICHAKIHVQVLYESLCPDSINFVMQQLYPIWNEVAPYVNIEFVPFGKSSSINGGQHFICQHGPKECMGNKIQSCALSLIPEQNAQVEYVNCFMSTFKKGIDNDNELGQGCAESLGLPWGYVANCYHSTHGTRLQLAAEKVTLATRPKFVPTIIYNGHFDQKAQDESQFNFKGVLCSFIVQLYPGVCQ